ncbi:MAG TPA: hypothetical protein VN457_01110 [Chlamydiales bacterium]|nr:hypothetical protein [Chlamydiales bacterium]
MDKLSVESGERPQLVSTIDNVKKTYQLFNPEAKGFINTIRLLWARLWDNLDGFSVGGKNYLIRRTDLKELAQRSHVSSTELDSQTITKMIASVGDKSKAATAPLSQIAQQEIAAFTPSNYGPFPSREAAKTFIQEHQNDRVDGKLQYEFSFSQTPSLSVFEAPRSHTFWIPRKPKLE